MKKLIRALIKIPATPFVLFYHLLFLFSLYITLAFEWLYEASDFDIKITREIIDDEYKSIKRWFTVI